MTVAELIAELQKLDPALPVRITDQSYGSDDDVRGVKSESRRRWNGTAIEQENYVLIE